MVTPCAPCAPSNNAVMEQRVMHQLTARHPDPADGSAMGASETRMLDDIDRMLYADAIEVSKAV